MPSTTERATRPTSSLGMRNSGEGEKRKRPNPRGIHPRRDGTLGKIVGPELKLCRKIKSRIAQLAECVVVRFSRMKVHYGSRFEYLRIRSTSPALEDEGDVE